ncbi:MAG: hypothetical protein R3C61_19260 [Bacteroidia bacterium]
MMAKAQADLLSLIICFDIKIIVLLVVNNILRNGNRLILLGMIVSVSCSTKTNNKDSFYFVIEHPEKMIHDKITPLPPPSPGFYHRYNFILVDTSSVFFHNKYIYYTCGTGIDFSKPPRLFLSADSLVEIKIEALSLFLQTTIPDTIVNGKMVTANISSQTDTIRNRAFKIITDYFNSQNIRRYMVRNWTEEEAFAVTSKINNSPYDPKEAEFIIGFDSE